MAQTRQTPLKVKLQRLLEEEGEQSPPSGGKEYLDSDHDRRKGVCLLVGGWVCGWVGGWVCGWVDGWVSGWVGG